MISHITRFIDLSDKNFFIAPKPLGGELLSSWLVRTALAHNTLPWTFMNLHFPEYRNIPFSRDLDVWVPDDMLVKLEKKSGYAFEQLYILTLRSYVGTLFPIFNPSCCNKYFSYIKVRGRSNQLFGQKFCSRCLQEDLVPYFRKEWRLKSNSACSKHQIQLSDRCENCAKPISFYKFSKDGKGYAVCWFCEKKIYNPKLESNPF